MSHHQTRRGLARQARYDRCPPPRNVQATIRVFVAMSLRHEEEPALIDYWHAMQRAAARAGGEFDVRRIEELDGDFEIIERIYLEIEAADLVIADLTMAPANVYLELGYARGKGKPIIQTCRADTPLEFDVRGRRTLIYRNAATLEEKLLRHLKAVRANIKSRGISDQPGNGRPDASK